MPRVPVSKQQLSLYFEGDGNRFPSPQTGSSQPSNVRLTGSPSICETSTSSRQFFSEDIPSPSKPKKYNPKNPAAYLAAIEDARYRISQRTDPNAWEGSTVETVLGLYSVLHERTYGVLPDDLASEWGIAKKVVESFGKKHFNGDLLKVVVLTRWKLAREIKFRKSNDQRARLVWRWVYNDRTVMDFKVEKK